MLLPRVERSGVSIPPPTALQPTIDRLREGVQIISHAWRYLYVNAAAAEHGRQRPEALLGRTMMEAYPGIEHTDVFAAMQRVMQTRQPERLLNEFTFANEERASF